MWLRTKILASRLGTDDHHNGAETRSTQDPGAAPQPPRERGGRLLRRTFLFALFVVSSGLLISGAVAFAFRYQESVAEHALNDS